MRGFAMRLAVLPCPRPLRRHRKARDEARAPWAPAILRKAFDSSVRSWRSLRLEGPGTMTRNPRYRSFWPTRRSGGWARAAHALCGEEWRRQFSDPISSMPLPDDSETLRCRLRLLHLGPRAARAAIFIGLRKTRAPGDCLDDDIDDVAHEALRRNARGEMTAYWLIDGLHFPFRKTTIYIESTVAGGS